MRGPGIFLAQFIRDEAPYNSLGGLCDWAASHGYVGVQIPTWESRLIDLKTAAESKDYCDELKGKVAEHGLEITELSSHLQGQLVAVHPAYDILFDNFAPHEFRNNTRVRTDWAIAQLIYSAKASKNLGLADHVTFSGALVWP